ncbi:MAG: hypothetical protein ACFFC7_26150 [Candidatus Hermodarchaeota archaeon]
MKKDREDYIKDELIPLEDFKPTHNLLLELRTALKVLSQILEEYADSEMQEALITVWNTFNNLTTLKIPANLESLGLLKENVTLVEKNAQLQQKLTRAHEYIRQHIKESPSDSTFDNKSSLRSKNLANSIFQLFNRRGKQK